MGSQMSDAEVVLWVRACWPVRLYVPTLVARRVRSYVVACVDGMYVER